MDGEAYHTDDPGGNALPRRSGHGRSGSADGAVGADPTPTGGRAPGPAAEQRPEPGDAVWGAPPVWDLPEEAPPVGRGGGPAPRWGPESHPAPGWGQPDQPAQAAWGEPAPVWGQPDEPTAASAWTPDAEPARGWSHSQEPAPVWGQQDQTAEPVWGQPDRTAEPVWGQPDRTAEPVWGQPDQTAEPVWGLQDRTGQPAWADETGQPAWGGQPPPGWRRAAEPVQTWGRTDQDPESSSPARDESAIRTGSASATTTADIPNLGFLSDAPRDRAYPEHTPAGGYRFGVSPADDAATTSDITPARASRRAVSDEPDRRHPAWRRLARDRRHLPLWQELPLLLVVAFCLAVLIRTFLLQAFYIPSSSMEETLLVGDRVLVNKIVYDVRQPKRGEVIVFRGTETWAPENPPESSGGLMVRVGRTVGDLVGMSRPGEKDFIKRVIGVPGDRVSCCDAAGRVYVNGKGLDEPYVTTNSPLEVPPDDQVCRSRRFAEVLVPPGQLFVMGDHRIVSQDSRCQGTVPIEDVIGRAFVIVWPSGRWDTLAIPDAFSDVPRPVALGAHPARSGPGPAGSPDAVGAALALPMLASLLVSRSSGRKWRWGRRTLPT